MIIMGENPVVSDPAFRPCGEGPVVGDRPRAMEVCSFVWFVGMGDGGQFGSGVEWSDEFDAAG